MKRRDLSPEIPFKTLVMGCFTRMPWGKAFSFFCLLKCGKVLPIEKHRGQDMRLQIMSTAQVCSRLWAKDHHVGCGICATQCLPVGNGKGNSAETAICSFWHCIKPLQRTDVTHKLAASCCRGAEALGAGWPHQHKGFMDTGSHSPLCSVDKQLSIDNKTPCFFSIACLEFADQCEIVNCNGLLNLCKRLLLLAAVDFLMNDH